MIETYKLNGAYHLGVKQNQVKMQEPTKELLNLLKIDNTKLQNFLTTNNYLSFSIPKSNGKRRWIDAPINDLKEIQKTIMYKLLYSVAPHDSACGFVLGKSPKTGASKHFYDGKEKLILAIDLKDYFTTINVGQIISAFYFILSTMNKTYGAEFNIVNDSKILGKLCSYKNVLPQGAVTSPALANIITKPMDKEIQDLCNRKNIKYTRYADDLAFSTTNLAYSFDDFLKLVKVIIQINGFKINNKKVRVLRPHRRQSITGVTINDKIGVSKKYYKNTRAAIHNIKFGRVELSRKNKQRLFGRINWIKSLDQIKGQKLLNNYNEALKKINKVKHDKKSNQKIKS